MQKAILTALGERDETAAICRGKNGAPEPDPDLRDTERVPLVDGEDPVEGEGVPSSVRAFFEREVTPHVPEAWIDTSKRDHRDGKVGFVGYEINFNRYFYRYKPPRPLPEIEADIQGYRKGHNGDVERYVRYNGLSHQKYLWQLLCVAGLPVPLMWRSSTIIND